MSLVRGGGVWSWNVTTTTTTTPGDIAIPPWSPSCLPRQAASQHPHLPKSEATQFAWVPRTDANDLQGSPGNLPHLKSSVGEGLSPPEALLLLFAASPKLLPTAGEERGKLLK